MKRRLEQYEADIRAGHGKVVAQSLAKINARQVPRALRARVANLCRRTGLINVGLRVLTPAMRQRELATAEELAEYGILLLKSDATREAWEVLDRVDPRQAPEALLYKAHHHFRFWREADAIPLLHSYLESQQEPYKRLIASVNLASAYIGADRFDLALGLLDALIVQARSERYLRALGNCLELRAQLFIKTGSFAKARQDLDESVNLLHSAASDQIYVKKWRAVLEGLVSGSVAPISAFREEAMKHREWECVREADRFTLSIELDRDRFEHLLFGTPFAAYRTNVCQGLGIEQTSASYRLQEPEGEKAGLCLELASGKIAGEQVLTPGRQAHLLLSVLLRDFYRPCRIGTLFSELFEGEHFDIATSPNRVHQALRRARRFFEQSELPFGIREVRGEFSLALLDSASIVVPYEHKKIEAPHTDFERLRLVAGPSQLFSSRAASEQLKIPRSSFQRLVKWALEKNLIEQVGTRNATCYRIKSSDAA